MPAANAIDARAAEDGSGTDVWVMLQWPKPNVGVVVVIFCHNSPVSADQFLSSCTLKNAKCLMLVMSVTVMEGRAVGANMEFIGIGPLPARSESE
jgi:hypothetical protein